jgi:hypothetical protein
VCVHVGARYVQQHLRTLDNIHIRSWILCHSHELQSIDWLAVRIRRKHSWLPLMIACHAVSLLIVAPCSMSMCRQSKELCNAAYWISSYE